MLLLLQRMCKSQKGHVCCNAFYNLLELASLLSVGYCGPLQIHCRNCLCWASLALVDSESCSVVLQCHFLITVDA